MPGNENGLDLENGQSEDPPRKDPAGDARPN